MPSTLCKQLKYPSGKLIYKPITSMQYWDLAELQHRPAGKKERHRREGREGYPFSVHAKFGVYNLSTLGFLWGDFCFNLFLLWIMSLSTITSIILTQELNGKCGYSDLGTATVK